MARLGNRLGRWLRASATGQVLTSHVGAFYIRFAAATTRWQVIGWDDHRAQVVGSGTGFIAAFWHGRLFMSPLWPVKGRRTLAMISNNRDGDLIAAVVRRFGALAVRGSTFDRAKMRDKGGAEAFARALAELQAGSVLGITPDGPRGPRMRAQPGAALLAIQTGCPIIPVTFSVRRGKTLRSWDRFLVPWPFGRGVQIYGAPLWPPEAGDDRSVRAFQDRLETALTDITQQADRMCGRQPVVPDPPVGTP